MRLLFKGFGGSKKIVGPALKRTGRALMVSPHKFLLTDLQLSLPQHNNSCHHHRRRRRQQHVCEKPSSLFPGWSWGRGDRSRWWWFSKKKKKCFKQLCHAGRTSDVRGACTFTPRPTIEFFFGRTCSPLNCRRRRRWADSGIAGWVWKNGLTPIQGRSQVASSKRKHF